MVHIDQVPISVLIEGVEIPAWLAKELVSMEKSEWDYLQVAARGLVARMAATNAVNRRDLARRAVAGELTPTQKVGQWAMDLSDEVLEYIEDRFDRFSSHLCEDLDSVIAIVSKGGDDAKIFVEDLMEQRDELESVFTVLRLAGRKDHIELLSILDHRAELLQSSFDLVEPEFSPVLESAALESPGAWWAPRLC